jgi:hypothetical protein
MSTTIAIRPSISHPRRVLAAIAAAAALAVGAGVAAVSLSASDGSTTRQPSAASAVATNVDVHALWNDLSTLPIRERDNVVAGLAPNVRAQLALLVEGIAVASEAH